MNDTEIDTLLEYYINRSSKDPFDGQELVRACLSIIHNYKIR